MVGALAAISVLSVLNEVITLKFATIKIKPIYYKRLQ